MQVRQMLDELKKKEKEMESFRKELELRLDELSKKDLSGIAQIDENSLHILETDIVPWAEDNGTSLGASKFYVFGNSDIGEFCIKFEIDRDKTDIDDYGAIVGGMTDGIFWRTNFTDLPLPLMKNVVKCHKMWKIRDVLLDYIWQFDRNWRI